MRSGVWANRCFSKGWEPGSRRQGGVEVGSRREWTGWLDKVVTEKVPGVAQGECLDLKHSLSLAAGAAVQ